MLTNNTRSLQTHNRFMTDLYMAIIDNNEIKHLLTPNGDIIDIEGAPLLSVYPRIRSVVATEVEQYLNKNQALDVIKDASEEIVSNLSSYIYSQMSTPTRALFKRFRDTKIPISAISTLRANIKQNDNLTYEHQVFLFALLLEMAQNFHPTGWIEYDFDDLIELSGLTHLKNGERMRLTQDLFNKYACADLRVVGSKKPKLCYNLYAGTFTPLLDPNIVAALDESERISVSGHNFFTVFTEYIFVLHNKKEA